MAHSHVCIMVEKDHPAFIPLKSAIAAYPNGMFASQKAKQVNMDKRNETLKVVLRELLSSHNTSFGSVAGITFLKKEGKVIIQLGAEMSGMVADLAPAEVV